VLDVSTQDSDTVQLFCRTRGQTKRGKYFALSHRWGSPAQHRKFCTYTSNIEQHRQGIELDELPQTFRDAVHITRALGIQYLWIDSLCIVQDDPQDWEIESNLMEQVFSSAYVTLTASCAAGTQDGFLKIRPNRECVNMRKRDGSHYYLCEAIDDFSSDVDHGELNKRGWVLQERALSRRTIYFAEKQTYWECGNGVRCETLTKMKNKKASFLGDSNFPNSVEKYVKGLKIQLFQSLYERYSNLDLSFDADRPIAIRGLEKRLVRTLQTVGAYGIFDCYLHRCLLWQRSDATLERIESFRGRPVPSWSWMAYTGGINYMDIPFGKVTWAKDIQSPFADWKPHIREDAEPDNRLPEIRALAWDLEGIPKQHLILDSTDRTFTGPLKYVIVGTEREAIVSVYQTYYVLIISSACKPEADLYERVGIGIIQDDRVETGIQGEAVRIL
jgi:hypothetical protein